MLIAIRSVIDDQEPLASAELDDFLDPRALKVPLADGIGDAESARIDVKWTTRDDYKFHYTESAGIDLRWGNHPHDGNYVAASGLEHYHPPPDASSDPSNVEDSCIRQECAKLVTLAVLKLWRVAYHSESLAPLDARGDLP